MISVRVHRTCNDCCARVSDVDGVLLSNSDGLLRLGCRSAHAEQHAASRSLQSGDVLVEGWCVGGRPLLSFAVLPTAIT